MQQGTAGNNTAENSTAGNDSAASGGLRSASFAAADDARTASWFEAVQLGFHEARSGADRLPAAVDAYQRDGRTLTAVYDDAAPEYAWDPAVPVATYATMVNALNVGGGRLLPAHLVTAVTVRATHRRRGILRSMMTTDLAAAKDSGLALAALTASEATIYGRFGFGAATSTSDIQVDTRGGLEFTAPPRGSIAVADSGKLQALAPDIYRAHLEGTHGALGRQHGYWLRAAGVWSEEGNEPDKALRAVIRYNSDGVPDGYAAYKSLGWRTEPHTVKVTDLVAANDEAYRELWRYLGSLDLVERVTFTEAPVADPLPWMLADRRRYRVTGVDDVLWVRLLDTRAALEARHYAGAGTVVLTVRDPLGMAGGVWQLEAKGGSGSVRPVEAGSVPAGAEAAHIDVAALGSLYLGGVSAKTLAAAGGIRGSREALDTLDALFTAGPAPYCSTHF